MFRVEIRSGLHGNSYGGSAWLDHLGNGINALVFSKSSYDEYIPGHYPLESFGSLYRNIDDFRQSPLQSLTDWKVRIPSVYSCGGFQTADLFYFLEYANANKNFNLLGCEAALLDDDELVFLGAVTSIASGTGGTMLSIGERIGAPEIKKRDMPLPLGNASMQHWPAKITENEMGQTVIWYTEQAVSIYSMAFSIYLGEKNAIKFAPVSIVPDHSYELEYSNGCITIASKGTDFVLEHDIEIGKPFTTTQLSPPDAEELPINYIAGEDSDIEFLQAWSNRLSSDGCYSLGRAATNRQRNHYEGEKIRRAGSVENVNILAGIRYIPESLTVDLNDKPITTNSPYTSGNPSVFLATSKDIDARIPIVKNFHPTAYYDEDRDFHVTFIINFPELDLPSSTESSHFGHDCKVRFSFDIEKIKVVNSLLTNQSTPKWEPVEKVTVELGGQSKNVSLSDAESGIFLEFKKNISELRQIKLIFKSASTGYSFRGSVTLGGVSLYLRAFMPFNDCKLYARGNLAASDSSSGKSIIPSVNGLLSAAQASDYEVTAIGDLSATKYGSVLSNEAVKFRDKLRELALESATLVKLNPIKAEFMVKSVSREFEHITRIIPLNAILLENNLYSFNMESSHRDDILSGILLSWGKNPETGKYEHSFSADMLGIFKDGNALMLDTESVLGAEKWQTLLEQLARSEKMRSNVASMESKWVTDWEGAELMAYNYLCWNCASLRKAQVRCILPVLREQGFDIGDFVFFDLPGYPPKLEDTAWVITGKHDDLDKMISTLELLECWNMRASSPDRFLLLESGGSILTEAAQNIKLESLHE